MLYQCRSGSNGRPIRAYDLLYVLCSEKQLRCSSSLRPVYSAHRGKKRHDNSAALDGIEPAILGLMDSACDRVTM